MISLLMSYVQEATQDMMQRAFDAPAPGGARGGDYPVVRARGEKDWTRTQATSPSYLAVAAETSRLRDPIEILETVCMHKEIQRKNKYSKFQTVRVPFNTKLGGFDDLVLTNAHLNNEVARDKPEARDAFLNRRFSEFQSLQSQRAPPSNAAGHHVSQ